jgi:hypothetical protein
MQYLHTFKMVILDNGETIKGFAHDVGRAVYDGPVMGRLNSKDIVSVHCYRDSEEVSAFAIIGGLIQTDDGHWFKFNSDKTDWRRIRPKIWHLEMRVDCRSKIANLDYYLKGLRDDKIYPAPAGWCDAITEHPGLSYRGKERIEKYFKCPGAQEGKCNYAMNPNCKRHSPGDMVLLFEAKAGWNQYGGPELFIFDNHDPKGGCVRLNDGTVKFIRTEEELRQLRWE